MHATEAIRKLSRRLGTLQAEVLADDQREPLHQLRVSLRRMRTVFRLLGPALKLPEGVSEARLASVARRTSLTRDLDVLHLRLSTEIAPLLSSQEQKALAKALKQLKQDREEAFSTLVEALTGKRYLKLLARLGRWLQNPSYTAMGDLPLRPWASEWLAPLTAGLFQEEGWFCEELEGETLHALRKRLKGVRYAMEQLDPLLSPPLLAWLETVRAAQDQLGNIHDLQVVMEAFEAEGHSSWSSHPLPGLRAALVARQQEHWQEWLHLRATLLAQRLAFWHDVLQISQP